jgi:paraquat-inducible protein A
MVGLSLWCACGNVQYVGCCSAFRLCRAGPWRGVRAVERCYADGRVDPVGRSLALALTGLLLFAVAVALPFVDINVFGWERETLLLTGLLELQQYGVWELAVAVLITAVGSPLARLLGLTYVLLGIHLPQPPRHLYAVFRWVEWLRSWSMVEVFLLGVFVAYPD